MSDNTVSENNQVIDTNYLKQKKLEASQIDTKNKNYSRNLHTVNLQPHTPDEYYNTLKDWREMESFIKPKKKYANQEAGISFSLRVKSFFNTKAKSELEIKKELADTIHKKNTKVALENYNNEASLFYEARKRQHDDINKLHEMMRQGNVEQIIAYFTFSLQHDNYTTDFVNQFHIDVADVKYDTKDKRLSYSYRIPNKEEILTFSSFNYDTKSDSILTKPIDTKYQLIQRTQIMHCVLIRSLIMVYESDKYGLVDDVEITGFLEYFDQSYGKNRHKDVVNFHMSRDEYMKTDFKKVNVESLFSIRLKAKETEGFYK